jgi:hypothetical protein
MGKSLFTITAAIGILSAGSLISDAQAGSSQSAPTKYGNHANQHVAVVSVRTSRASGPVVPITEFSSSSAPTGTHGPRR